MDYSHCRIVVCDCNSMCYDHKLTACTHASWCMFLAHNAGSKHSTATAALCLQSAPQSATLFQHIFTAHVDTAEVLRWEGAAVGTASCRCAYTTTAMEAVGGSVLGLWLRLVNFMGRTAKLQGGLLQMLFRYNSKGCLGLRCAQLRLCVWVPICAVIMSACCAPGIDHGCSRVVIPQSCAVCWHMLCMRYLVQPDALHPMAQICSTMRNVCLVHTLHTVGWGLLVCCSCCCEHWALLLQRCALAHTAQRTVCL
jgi:hypothetical protein